MKLMSVYNAHYFGESELCEILLDIAEREYPQIMNNHDVYIKAVLCQVIKDNETLIHSID